MFKLARAGLAAVALLATSIAASAADMRAKPYYKGPPRSVIAYYNWSGAYAGVFAGYAWGSSTWDDPAATTKPKGWMFGGTLGYNWQVGSFVYGIEGDLAWSGMKGSTTCAVVFTCETKNTYLGTARGRIGMAFDTLLPYVTGGLAVGDIKAISNDPVFPGASKTKWGWTLGGGFEYAFLTNWTAKAEYLYFDLGNMDCGLSCGPTPPNRVSLTGSRATVGLNYKFGSRSFGGY